MGGELLRRSSSMLPSYHRSSSTGVELDYLTKNPSSPPSPSVENGGGVVAEEPPPSNYNCVRDFLVSVAFFLLGWWGPKYMLPSEEFLQQRQIPYQVLNSTNEVILDLSLNNPLVHPPTVPSASLIFGSIWVPIIVMSVVGLFLSPQRSYQEVLVGISSLFLGVGGSEGSTQLLKHWVLRRRPNFYALCGFNVATLQCENEYHEVLEAQMSFPSGHSSLSWCGMVVLTLFLLKRRQNRGGKLFFFISAVLPLSFATFVASTRIVDHWHHVSDVLTGVFLGCLWGTIGYHIHHSTPNGASDTQSSASYLPISAAPKLPSSHK